MKMKLTNEKVFEIFYILKKNYEDLTKYDKRFNFAVTRTLSNLQPIASDLLKARESEVKRFEEFEEKKINIIKSYSISVENNVPIYESDEMKSKCQEDINKLVDEYKDAIEERQKEVDIFNEILEEEVEVDIVQCRFEALPDNFDFNFLRVLVKESDEEIEDLL